MKYNLKISSYKLKKCYLKIYCKIVLKLSNVFTQSSALVKYSPGQFFLKQFISSSYGLKSNYWSKNIVFTIDSD